MLSGTELFSNVDDMSGVIVENLVVDYDGLRAVNNVSFTAPAGRVTVVLGPNGAGKTSTIEVCEGFRRASSGRVEVNGLDPVHDHDALTREMGVMLQGGGVYPSARVSDVVSHFCALYGDVVSANSLIERVGLNERRHGTWRRLSGGEQQRVSLALALAGRPRVVFLDEPTSGVDVNGREVIRGIVRELADEGCTVVLATHELDEAERVADTVVIFDGGHIIASGSLDELRRGGAGATFTSSPNLDVSALSIALGAQVDPRNSSGLYGVTNIATSDSDDLVVKLSRALAEQNARLESFNATESLESIFRRLTAKGDK